MSIRIPTGADPDTLACFRDIEEQLNDLKAAQIAPEAADIEDTTTRIEQLERRRPDDDRDAFVAAGSQAKPGLVPSAGNTELGEVLGSSGWVNPNLLKLPAADQSAAGVTDIFTLPGSMHVAGSLEAGELHAKDLIVDKSADLRIQQANSNTIPLKVKAFADQTDTGTSPELISGLSGWWKADAQAYTDAGSTLATDGQTVQQWNDQSGNARHFSEATNKPTYKTSIVNGKPVIRFDGTNDLLSTTATMNDFMTSTAGTIFCVAYVHTITTLGDNPYLNDMVWSDTTAGPSVRHHMGLNTTPNILAFHYDGSEDTVTKTIATGTWYVTLYMMSGGSLYVGLNDARTTSLSSVASGASTSMTGIMRLAVNYGAHYYTQVDIAEMIIYNVGLSESNRQEVEKYLADKYGITLGYPTAAFSNDDLFRIEEVDGTEVFRIANNGDVYSKATKMTVP